MKGEYSKAEEWYHQAIAIAREKFDKEEANDATRSKHLAYIYDMMGNLAWIAGNLEQSVSLFKETMRLLIAGGLSSGDEAIVEISLKLANIYAGLGDHKLAEQGFDFCVATMKSKVAEKVERTEEDEKNVRALLGMCEHHFARYLTAMKQADRAMALFEDAIKHCHFALGEQHPQCLNLLSDLATSQTLARRYTQALQNLRKLIEISDISGRVEEIPTYYNNLGAIYLQLGYLTEAHEACTRARKAARANNDHAAERQSSECLSKVGSVAGSAKE